MLNQLNLTVIYSEEQIIRRYPDFAHVKIIQVCLSINPLTNLKLSNIGLNFAPLLPLFYM